MTAVRVLLGLCGLVLIGYGAVGVATDPGASPVGQLVFLAVVVAGHDLVVLPLAIGAGAVVARLLPHWARGPVHGGLFASAVLTLVALPFVIGAGRRPDDPSALPLDYGRGLLVVLTVVWASTMVLVARNARRATPARDDD